MKRIFKAAALAAILAAFTSCAEKEINAPQPAQEGNAELVKVTFNAEAASFEETKLVLGDDKLSLNWKEGEKIAVYDGTALREFTTEKAGTSSPVTGEVSSSATEFYALYPYSSGASFTAKDGIVSVNASVPGTQAAVTGNIPDEKLILAAYSTSKTELPFQSMLSAAKVTVDASKLEGHSISSITLTSENYPLSGDVKISYDGSDIEAAAGSESSRSVTLSGSGALADGDYYFLVLPNAGGKVTLSIVATDGYTASVSATLKAFSPGVIKNVGTIQGLSWTAPPTYEAQYVVATTSSVTTDESKFTYPENSSATYSATYSSVYQMTKGNSMTLTLKGYDGVTITGIILSMRSNKSSGSGYYSVKVGDKTISSLGSSSSGVAFSAKSFNGEWSLEYVDLIPIVTPATVAPGEDVVITIGATANSLFCRSFTIQYQDGAGGGTTPGETTVTTAGASSITTESASLSGSYANAKAVPTYKGFQWGTSEAQVIGSNPNDQQSETALTSLSGDFTADLTGLASNTTYYYRAYVRVLEDGVSHFYYGEVRSFKTKSPNPEDDGDQKGWFELPVMNYTKNTQGYLIDDNNPNLYYAYHIADVGSRNYTVCYNGSYHCPVWVAAPRHSIYSTKVVERTKSYYPDPDIPSNVQQANDDASSGYNKGHMLGSAERLGSRELNRQVMYYTNIAPQNSSWFNTGGGGWNILEDFVDDFECSDTLYVVIGCYFEAFKDGYNNSATKQTASFMGVNVQIPTAFYYALLRTKRGNTGKSLQDCSASEMMCAAFVRAHASGTKGQAVTKAEMMSIDDLEELTGFDYFANVPNAPESTFTASDWGL